MLLSIGLESILRGVLGMAVLVGIAYLFSSNRKAINWALIGKGLLIQLIFAVLILKVDFVETGFSWLSEMFIRVIGFTQQGTDFLFGSFITGNVENGLINFVFKILPTIVFFSALTSMLFYLGILQKIVFVLAWFMKKTMKLSGAESLSAAGNIFLGQTESPFLIKPYLSKMTKSEMMCLMSGGMATIAGGVLAAYIGFLGGDDINEQAKFAKHLLAASVMSAPAAIVAAKILVPETEEFNQSLEVAKEKIGSNVLEAIANGTGDGIKLAVNVGAMLLVFIALMAFGNAILGKVGQIGDINGIIAETTRFDSLSFQFLLGYLCAPIAWLMGVPKEDMILVGQLIGEKTVLNEFVAYMSLGKLKAESAFVHEKSIIMATYVLCGFANFASIGIQLGGIGAIAPSQKATLAEFGVKALIGGTIACFLTATIAGMIV